MIRRLKIILSLGIFVCMFLPLSQCSGGLSKVSTANQKIENSSGTILDPQEQTPKVIKLSVPPSDLGGWLVCLAFVVPLIGCVTVKKKKYKVVILSIQTLSLFWLFFVIDFLVYTFTPLFGGYLLTIFSLLYFFITLFEWYELFFKKPKSQNILSNDAL